MSSAPRRVANPPNPWAGAHVEWLEAPPDVALEVYEEDAKSILSTNDSPDLPFRFSLNPYRGCQHACAYCYARPTHTFLDFGAGTDFDSKIVVKRNAAELLRHELATRQWKHGREWIAFSGVTDCYQPLEASYGITRACLEICDEFRHPFGIITKSALIRRDIDVLARAARRGGAHVTLSIPFANAQDARALEPWASAPATRFETIARLADARIPVGVALAPLIPGLNDSAVPEILERARDAGATQAFTVLLRLPLEVRPVFEERMRAAFPLRARKILNALKEMRDGSSTPSAFGERMRGRGARFDAISQLFRVHCRRLGLAYERGEGVRPKDPLQRSDAGARQLGLFD